MSTGRTILQPPSSRTVLRTILNYRRGVTVPSAGMRPGYTLEMRGRPASLPQHSRVICLQSGLGQDGAVPNVQLASCSHGGVV